MTTRHLSISLRPLTAALLAGGWLGLLPLPGGAASAAYFWQGWIDNSWIEAGNWDPPGPPTAGSGVMIALPDASVDFDSTAGFTYQSLYLSAWGGAAVLNQAAHSLSFAEWVTIGLNADEFGTMNQSGASFSVGSLLGLGRDAGATGGYHLTGGSLTALGATTVGIRGEGHLTIDGGTFEQATPDTLFLVGEGPTGWGRVDLKSGSLRMLGNEEKIGGGGTGYFYQSGGEHQFGGGLYVGDTGYGEYHMLGGSLGPVLDGGGNPVAYAGIVMGEWAGTGKFFHSGGTVDADSVVLARQAGSTGLYEMSGDGAEL